MAIDRRTAEYQSHSTKWLQHTLQLITMWGKAMSHHFFIRCPHEEIGQQFKCLILLMTQYLLITMPAPEPDPHDATTVSNSIQVTRGLLTASIWNTLLF